MDITKFFDRKMTELNSQLTSDEDSERYYEESTNSTSTPTSHGSIAISPQSSF